MNDVPTQKPPQPPQPPVIEGTEVKAALQRKPKPPLPCLVEVERQLPMTSKKPQRQPEPSESTKLSTQELLAGAPVRERQAHNTRCTSQSLDEDSTKSGRS